MKTQLKFWIAGVVTLCTAAACTNDQVNPRDPPSVFPDDNPWLVTWFWDQDKDETSDLAPYTFYFKDGNILEAERNGSITTGSWSITSDDGSSRLVISLSPDKPLSELNDDWVIIESSDQMLKLQDDNTQHLEELIFERKQ